MSVGTSKSFLLAALTLLSIMKIGIQTTDKSTSLAISSIYLMINFELNLAGKQNKPIMASRIPSFIQPSMKDLYQIRSGYVEEKQDSSSEAFNLGIDSSTEILRNYIDSSSETLRHDIDSSSETLRHDIDSSSETLRHDIDSSTETLRHDIDSSTEILRHDIDSSTETLCHDIDSSSQGFHLGLDNSTGIILSGLDSTDEKFHHRVGSAMVTLGLDNSTTNCGHRSNNSKDTIHDDAGRSIEISEDGSDDLIDPIGYDSYIYAGTNDAPQVVFMQMHVQLSSTSDNINTVHELDENYDMNIKETDSGFPSSCDQRCGYVIAASDDNLYPCHCDQACWLYGDCCSDYYFICLQQNINATSDRILHAVLDRLETFSQVLQLREDYIWSRISNCSPLESKTYYFRLVNMCSDDPQILAQFEELHRDLTNPLSESSDIFVELSKKEIRQRCERNSTSHTKHIVLDYTHVTLVHHTAIHFYNVFCAICNGINPSQVTVWEANVKCGNTTLNFIESGSFVNDSISETIIRNNCTITNADFNTSSFRACFPKESLFRSDISENDIQSICMSWNHTTWLLCQRYQNPYMEPGTSRMLKNLHCLVCDLHAQAQTLNNNNKEYILSKGNYAMKLINEFERRLYVCKNKSHNQCPVNNVNIRLPVYHIENQDDTVLGEEPEAIASLRIMYDFRSHQATVTVNHTVRTIEMKACPQDQVYLPQYQSCGQAFCPPGKRLLLDQCVSVCSEDRTTKNESCRLDGNQTFDYKYLPCLHGCQYINLNIFLEYILLDDVSSDSLSNGIVTLFNTDDNENHDNNNDSVGSSRNSSNSSSDGASSCGRSSRSSNDGDGSSSSRSNSSNYSNIEKTENSTKDVSATNTVIVNITQPRNNITCLSPKNNMPFLFEVSHLKTVWVKQMNSIMNSTEFRQNRYRKMVKLVLRRISNKVIHYLDNSSLIDHVTVCPNSTCLTYGINMTEIDTSHRKVYPYNPCFRHSGRSNDTKYETINRPGVCISFVAHLNSSKDFDTFVRATKILVSDIVRSAHQTNFILSRMEITNMINITNDIHGEVTGRQNSISNGSNVKFTTSSGDLCQNGEVLAYTETTVERYNNGTHAVNLNGTDINLVNLLFTMEIYRHLKKSEKQVNLATVGWCQVELIKLNCGSFPFILYEPDNFVIYNGTLVLTSMADKLIRFLYNSSFLNHVMEDITSLMTLFAKQYGVNNWTIVQQGFYIQTRAGILVCSNLSNEYLLENYISHYETVLRFIPDSEAMILASEIACGLSLFCLTCTLAIYSLVPSLRNVPGKIVMSFSAALLCAQVLFLCCTKPKGFACEVYASIHHAAWLASYMWLGAMSVHLACILNSQCNIQINMTGSNIFKLLAVVCWGFPCLLAGVCLVLHKTKVITIGYGNNGVCWIGSMKQMLILYGVPVFLILAVTLVSAVFVVMAIRKSITFRKKGVVLRGKPNKQLILCVNLSLLMGFSWVFYFLAVGTDNGIVWTVHILVNGSQGLYVFLCFAARKSLLSTAITKMKFPTILAGKSNVSSDIIKLKMSPTTVSPFSDHCPSVKSLSISK